MPRKRKGRKKSKRRKKRGRTTVAVGRQVVADRTRLKLSYSQYYNLTITAGVVAYQRFKGNSVFDPDSTGGGHQPTGFDQWAAFYHYTRVIGSAIHVRMLPTDATGVTYHTLVYGVWPVPVTAAAAVTDPSNIEEQAYAKLKWLNIYTAGQKDQNIRSYMSTAKIFGDRKVAVVASDGYQALVTGDPANLWYWNVFVRNADAAAINTTATMGVKITYYVELTSRKVLAVS